MTSRPDPKGYYAILQVAPNASAALIKAAYRQRAMELHPDRNKSKSATGDFQLLTQAYNVLSDSKQRADYDSGAAVSETAGRDKSGGPGPKSFEPIACSVCGKVSAQTRYCVFWEVKSFILVTHRSPVQGVFCTACAEQKAIRASGITWFFGWWGFPWGPIYSFHALFSNMIGGAKPALANAKILAYQAFVFGKRGRSDISFAIAREALKFARRAPHNDLEAKSLVESLQKMCKSAPPNLPRLVNAWRLLTRPFFYQAGVLATAVCSLVIVFNLDHGAPPRNTGSSIADGAAPRPSFQAPAPNKSSYVRPATAPNGEPWPRTAAYVQGYRKRNMKGLSTITIDNSRSDSDVFVKLDAINAGVPTPVRVFFIPAFGQFTAKKLTKGTYRVEYKDLDTGRSYRGDPFEAEEVQEEGGVQYSADSLTLYKVPDGNANIEDIGDSDFDAGLEDATESNTQFVSQ